MQKVFKVVFILLGASFITARVHAQWTNQTITLNPGWNAVFLQLDPQPSDCASLFSGLPIERAWGWRKHFTTVQYIQNPGDLAPGQPDWLVWSPDPQIQTAVNLFHLQAEHAYLIKVATNAAPFTWTIYGRPTVRSISWYPDSFNFLGLHVDPLSPPTFQDFFAASPAHVGQPIFRLTPAGIWTPVYPASERPQAGVAYWVRCAGVSTFAGPLSVTLDQGRSMDYGRALTEQTLTILNASTNDRTVTVAPASSGAAPGAAYPVLAGEVPLSSFVMNYPSSVGFFPLVQPITNVIPAGGQWALRLSVRRPDMTAPPPGTTNFLYETLLRVSDGAGTLQIVPVTAQGMTPSGSGSVTNVGLWVGTATINQVGNANNPSAPPTNTAAAFQFRLMVHQGTNGLANLLQQIYVAFQSGPGTNAYATNYPVNGVTNQNSGSYVLLLNPLSHTNLTIIRRFSSAAFGFTNGIIMTPTNAAFGLSNTTLNASVFCGAGDPTNPFRHIYHPEHGTGYNVLRYITLQFTATDPEGLTLPGWGDTMLGGYYHETISGIHKNPIQVQGTFRLHLAVSTGSFN